MTSKRWKIVGMSTLLVVAAAVVVVLWFDGGDSGGDAADAQSASGRTSVDDTLVVGDVAVPDSLDPDGSNSQFIPNQTAVAHLYDGLLALAKKPNDPEFGGGLTIDPPNVEPLLAESFEGNEDNTEWTVKLREGVLSNYGNELTAEDVKWSYDRVIANESVGFGNLARNASVKSLEVVDKYTVKITSTPNATVPLVFATRLTVVPYDSTEAKKHATRDDKWAGKWLNKNHAGFGPYELASLTEGQEMTLQARGDYWGEKPAFKTVKVLGIPESSGRLSGLKRGDLDVAVGLTVDEATEAGEDENLKLVEFTGNAQVWVWPHSQLVEPLRDPRVRQAMAYAIPYQELIDEIYQGRAEVAGSLVPSYVPYSEPDYFPYAPQDLEKARELLAEAGYPDGFRTEMIYPIERDLMEPVAAVLQAAWQEIGIDVKLTKRPESELASRAIGEKNVPIWLSDTLSMLVPDGSTVTGFFVTGAVPNVGKYQNEEAFDKFHADGVTEADPEARADIYRDVQRVLAEDLPIIPVLTFRETYAMKKDLDGFWWHPDRSPRVMYMTPAR